MIRRHTGLDYRTRQYLISRPAESYASTSRSRPQGSPPEAFVISAFAHACVIGRLVYDSSFT